MQAAIDKIKQAKRAGLTFLDLSGFGLLDLPQELFDLIKLESLILGRYNTPKKNRIKNVSKEIGSLINLKVLDFTDNQISSLPDEIEQLKKLKKLVLSSNDFRKVPNKIYSLKALTELFMGNNKIANLPPEITNLIKLESLRLNNNYLTTIPEEIISFRNLQYLYLHGNAIKGVPKELLGINSKENVCEIIKQWFHDKTDGESFVYESKLIIVGEAESGKTTLSEKLRNPEYVLNPTEPMTKGIDIKKWEFNFDDNKMFCANIWDFGGQDIMHATHRYFLTERSLYILVVDVRADKTDFYYWLNIIESFSSKSPVIIVLNEKHAFRKDISETIINRFKDTIVGVFNVDLKTNEGFNNLRLEVIDKLKTLPHIGQEKMLDKWLSIRNLLRENIAEFITYDEYSKITKQFGITDLIQSKRLAKILHDLGDILYFPNDYALRNTVILNKTWATEAVYLVILDKFIVSKFGQFNLEDLDRIWKDYPAEKRIDLLQLMINFQLCYEVSKNQEYIIPQLLPENPTNKNYKEYLSGEKMFFRFSYPKFMPKGIISRIIIKLNKLIVQDIKWKTGCLLKSQDVFAEITENFFERKVNICLTGKNKRKFLTLIINEINEINEEFEKLEVEEEVPCGCLINEIENKPYFIEKNTLNKYKQQDQKFIKCSNCLKDLRVLQLLDNYYGDDEYLGEIESQFGRIPNRNYILSLLNFENNNVEFKSSFIVPTYSKTDKIFLEDEYPELIKKSETQNNPLIMEAADKKKSEIALRLKSKEAEEIVIFSVLKTLVAFANSNGGDLIIGIDEDKSGNPYVLGMAEDIKKAGSKDNFLNEKFDTIIKERIGDSFSALIEYREWILIDDDKEVWLLRIKESSQEVYLKTKTKEGLKESFYIRREASTALLEASQLVKYIKERF